MGPEGIILVNPPNTTLQQSLTHSALEALFTGASPGYIGAALYTVGAAPDSIRAPIDSNGAPPDSIGALPDSIGAPPDSFYGCLVTSTPPL